MSVIDLNLNNITGTEALTVGEHISLLSKELSLKIDKLNAKMFNKSIHTVDGKKTVQEMTNRNNYFSVSFKHIASPVFFNPGAGDFKTYVETIARLGGMVGLVTTQAEDVYRQLKKVAASGIVPHSLRNSDGLSVISAGIEQMELLMKGSGPQTRPVSDFYPNWQAMDLIYQDFNRKVVLIKSRDVEVLAKQADQIVGIAQVLKRKIDNSEITISPEDFSVLNEIIRMLDVNMKAVGQALIMLGELTGILETHTKQLPELRV